MIERITQSTLECFFLRHSFRSFIFDICIYICFIRAEEWCVISHKETFPRIMDIDMAVERLCAKKFIDENSYILMQHATIQKKEPIPQLFSCEYIIGTFSSS